MLCRKKIFVTFIILTLLSILIVGCSKNESNQRKVVIYTSVDQNFSEPLLKGFEEETGIKVLAKYDVEAAKTTGLVNKLIAEKDSPQADVFWNGEFAQTILLKEKGVLEAFDSKSTESIPEEYKDSEGFWFGFGGRARVFIVNTNILKPSEYPTSIYDLLDEAYNPEKVTIAYPLFGTTATHASALYATWGKDKADEFFKKVKDRGIRVVDGNSVVRDIVARGEAAFGYTDTDDAIGAVERGEPVTVVFPDQGEDGMGTLIIPNTVALVKGGSNPKEAKELMEYLLSKEVEKKLMDWGWFQISFRGVKPDEDILNIEGVKGMDVNLGEVYDNLEDVKKELTEIFVR